MMSFMSPLILLALLFGGEKSLSGYIHTETYWQRRGVAYEATALTALLPLPLTQDPAEIDRWIEGLGAAQFADREEASRRLRDIGEPARRALQRAGQSRDPEVAVRAKKILQALTSESEAEAVDPGMVFLSLTQMTDPRAELLLKQIAAGPAGGLQRQAAAWLESNAAAAVNLPPGQQVAAGFPGDSCLMLQLRTQRRESNVLRLIHQSPEIQERMVNAFKQCGDIRVHRITLSLNEGLFAKKQAKVLLRVEMDYDPARLASALEKLGFQQMLEEPMRMLRRKELRIFLSDNRNLVVAMESPDRETVGVPEVKALLSGGDQAALPSGLLARLQALPESAPVRGALLISAAAMAGWEDFSGLHEAAFEMYPGEEGLQAQLRMDVTDSASAEAFGTYLEKELIQIRELFQQGNDDWILPMRQAVEMVDLQTEGPTVRLSARLPEAVLTGTLQLVERHLKHQQEFRQQKLQHLHLQGHGRVF